MKSVSRPWTSRQLSYTILGALLVMATLVFVSDAGAWFSILKRFRIANLWAGLALVLCNYGLRWVRWEILLRKLGVRTQTSWSILTFVSGFTMAISPGKMGELFKAWLLQRSQNSDIKKVASVVVVERITDLIALSLIIALSCIYIPRAIPIAIASLCVVSLIWAVCIFPTLANMITKGLKRHRWTSGFASSFQESWVNLRTLLRSSILVKATLLGGIGWGFECIALGVLLQGLGTAQIPWFGAAFAYAASTIAGALVMIPGGLGVTEVGMAGLLLIASPQITQAAAATATVLERLITLWFGVALGAAAWLWFEQRMRQQRTNLPNRSIET